FQARRRRTTESDRPRFQWLPNGTRWDGRRNQTSTEHDLLPDIETVMKLHQISRRSFLKATTATIIAAPVVLPSRARGADGATAPSERVTVGFIGTGKMAHDFHLSTLSGFKDVECLAVCDVDTARRLHAKNIFI